jgi:ssDNA-binding Zn-finger/Zn-ribbon topoisomerase 1
MCIQCSRGLTVHCPSCNAPHDKWLLEKGFQRAERTGGKVNCGKCGYTFYKRLMEDSIPRIKANKTFNKPSGRIIDCPKCGTKHFEDMNCPNLTWSGN